MVSDPQVTILPDGGSAVTPLSSQAFHKFDQFHYYLYADSLPGDFTVAPTLELSGNQGGGFHARHNDKLHLISLFLFLQTRGIRQRAIDLEI